MRYLVPFALLVACTVPETTAVPDGVPVRSLPDTCDASRHIGLVGQPATALERVLIMDMVRVIRPGDMVTMDYRDTRINFYISDQNTISDVRCG